MLMTQNPSTFLHFPSPFLLDHDDDFLLNDEAFPWDDPIFNDLQIFASCGSVDPGEGEINEPVEINKEYSTSVKHGGKKRHGKKDRHSKIYTARGPRDRRMRLSLEVARRFFDLQDMLGFDKASKTIEWLFSKSKGPIRELSEKASSYNFLPMIYESSPSSETGRKAGLLELDPVVKRELRHKARERARERTKQKLKMRFSSSSAGNNKAEEITTTTNNSLVSENQHQNCYSTFALGKYSSDGSAAAISTNPTLFDSVLPINQIIAHHQQPDHFSFLIANYLSPSIFGSI